MDALTPAVEAIDLLLPRDMGCIPVPPASASHADDATTAGGGGGGVLAVVEESGVSSGEVCTGREEELLPPAKDMWNLGSQNPQKH